MLFQAYCINEEKKKKKKKNNLDFLFIKAIIVSFKVIIIFKRVL